MELSFGSRLKHAWNAFTNRDPTSYRSTGYTYSSRPDRARFTRGNERTIVTSVYNRIALDVAAIDFKHCRLDENERYVETIKSGLNNCLTLEANLDQTGRSFMQDVVMSMMDEGCVAIVPVDTSFNPTVTGSYDILSMRTGKVLEWMPKHVKVRVYNDKTGDKEDIVLPKNMVAIIENPLYAVVNEHNSTMQRLIRKLSLLDIIDEQSGAGKLDMIIQLPYIIKSEARREQAEKRRKEIEDQLAGSKYGIAYADGTEKITQLNRSLDNNLMKQIEYLTSMLYSQLGITEEIMNGTADEKTMLNYYNRSIQPIVSAIVDEIRRKFLTKTARSQMQTIMAFRDPFKLVPVNSIAEIADKFTRNEIMTSNEIRQVIGMKPSSDPKADQLVNSNISQPDGGMEQPMDPSMGGEMDSSMDPSMGGEMDPSIGQPEQSMDPSMGQPEQSMAPAEQPMEEPEEQANDESGEDSGKTVADVFNELNEEQTNAVYAMISKALEEKSTKENTETDTDKTISDVFNELTEEQTTAVYAMISKALEENKRKS